MRASHAANQSMQSWQTRAAHRVVEVILDRALLQCTPGGSAKLLNRRLTVDMFASAQILASKVHALHVHVPKLQSMQGRRIGDSTELCFRWKKLRALAKVRKAT